MTEVDWTTLLRHRHARALVATKPTPQETAMLIKHQPRPAPPIPIPTTPPSQPTQPKPGKPQPPGAPK